MAELNIEVFSGTAENVPEGPSIPLMRFEEKSSITTALSENLLKTGDQPCPCITDMSKSFQCIAEHIHLNGQAHQEQCFSMQNFDGNDETVQTCVHSMDAIRNVVRHNTTTNKGNYKGISMARIFRTYLSH